MVRGWRFIEGFMHPNFTSRADEIAVGLQESIAMTVCATVVGIVAGVVLDLRRMPGVVIEKS